MVVRFKDLSIPLKIAIIATYIHIAIYAIGFIVGVILGIIESVK